MYYPYMDRAVEWTIERTV